MKTITLIITFLLSGLAGISQDEMIHPTKTSHALYFDKIPSLKALQPSNQLNVPIHHELNEENESEGVPNEINLKNFPKFKRASDSQSDDPLWQKQDGILHPVNHAPVMNFEGMNNTCGCYPPDTQGDVGGNYYVQVVNSSFTVYNKTTGVAALGPASLATIWTGIPAPWNGTDNGDPVVLFDNAADRWIISQFSLPNSTQYAELIAVSQTNDPTGAWYRYVFQFGSNMPDYPKLGVWPDGYYMSINQFASGSTWAGAGACSFERAKMIVGDASAQMVYFDLGASSDPGGMLPSDWDGSTTPAAGSPNYFTYFNDWSSSTEQYLRIWQFHTDWTTPTNSTFSQNYSLVTAPFTSSNCSSGNCIRQKGSTVTLESLSDRLMYRLQYRNFGTYETMVTCHNVYVTSNGQAGVRWYELRNTGGGWGIYQQGTYAPDTISRWMGSIGMNVNGDIALGYSASCNAMYPSIYYTGRYHSDPLGQMTIAEQLIKAGTGYQSGSAARWGDYSNMSLDVDDGTFWYTTEYIQTSGSVNWQTRIASFQLAPVPPVSNFSAATTKPCQNATCVFTDLSAGVPTSWSWTVAPGTYSFVDGTTATSQNPHIRFNALGNYTIALTATNAQGSNTNTKTNYIAVNSANSDFSASLTTVVVGYSTVFTDASTCNVTSYAWNFGANATPATANTAGPHTVTYSATGAKTVSLTVNGSITNTKTNYITVIDPVYNMSTGTITACTGNFYDPGGVSGSYSNNQDFTETFNPMSGNKLQFVFTSFDLEANSTCGYDYLKIYNGINTSAPLIGTYCGTTSPGTVTANNASGALTFVFHSDVSVTGNGWAATLNCISITIPPVADFSVSNVNPCLGNTVTFTDLSNNAPTSWNWSFSPNTVTFMGGTTATSQNPQVKFNAGGAYSVTLTATNSYGNNSMTKSNYINVGGSAPPSSDGFESGTFTTNSWTIDNPDNSYTWAIATTAGNGSSTKSAWMNFYSYSTIGAKDNLNSKVINLSGCSSAKLKFNVAYREYSTSYIDSMKIYISSDCGTTFGVTPVYSKYGANLATGALTTSAFTPSIASDWRTDSIDLTSYTGQSIVIRFQAINGYGNNLYIDDVNLTAIQSSKTVNLTLFLEGLYNKDLGSMNKTQDINGNHFPGSIADQISINIAQTTAPYTILYTVNNVALNQNGTATATIPGSYNGSYYILVRHRNSVETWTATPISFAPSVISYNFTTSASQAYRNNLKNISPVWAIYTGDINQDGIIDTTDLLAAYNDCMSFASGYQVTDINGDGVIDGMDLLLIDNNTALFVSKSTP